MKRVILALSLTMIMGFLAQAEAALITLDNVIKFNSRSTITWLQRIISTDLNMVLSGSHDELSFPEVDMGRYTSIYPGDTVAMNLGDAGRGPVGWWRNNHDNPVPVPVPEPATLLFLGTGLLGIARYLRVLGGR